MHGCVLYIRLKDRRLKAAVTAAATARGQSVTEFVSDVLRVACESHPYTSFLLHAKETTDGTDRNDE